MFDPSTEKFTFGSILPFTVNILRIAPWNHPSRFSFGGYVTNTPAEKKSINGHTYVVLPHNQPFHIELTNNGHTECDATVELDGKSIGNFRVNAQSTIKIQRPAGIDRELKFVAETSSQATQAGVTMGSDRNGVLKVTFKPRKLQQTLSGPGQRFGSKEPASDPLTASFYGSASTISSGFSFGFGTGSPAVGGFGTVPVGGGFTFGSSASAPAASASFGFGAHAGWANINNSQQQYSSGATILSGQTTGQLFKEVPDIPEDEIDTAKVATVVYRLVAESVPQQEQYQPIALSKMPQEMLVNPVAPPRIELFSQVQSNSNKSQVSILAQSQVSCLAKFESKIINTSSSNLYS